jgi:phosphoribosyl 1,2-cyclic phosphodiesterase
MGKLFVLGSSSKGNGYILTAGKESLIIELGCNWDTYAWGLNYNLKSCGYALASHAHSDHLNNSTAKKAMMYGLRVCGPKSVADKCGCLTVNHGKKYSLGGFKVIPLKVPHGECECFSYVIQHPDFGTLLFATDLTAFPYSIKCDHLLIEANYSEDIALDAVLNGVELRSASQNHCELNTCIDIINKLNRRLNTVVLLHLSSNLSNEKIFIQKVLEGTGIKPIIADSGVTIELKKEEF